METQGLPLGVLGSFIRTQGLAFWCAVLAFIEYLERFFKDISPVHSTLVCVF